MTGLDKIIGQILDDAGKEAEQAIMKAQSEADQIKSAAKVACDRLLEEGEAKLKTDAVAYMDRISSSADLKKRQAVLLAKQEIIADMLERAYQSLLSKETDEYFALIQHMLDKFVLAKQGEIYFNQKDLKRMPDEFEAALEAAAEAKGGSLKLNREPKDIDGGFILVYGGVEENCSFKALLSAQKDRLSDRVQELLFS